MITKSKLLSFFKTYHLPLITYHFKSGQLIIVSLIFLTVVMILAASLFGRTARFLRFGANSVRADQALNLAEAGIDRAVWQLNKNPGAYNGEPNTAIGTTGTFSVQITEKTPVLKTITATGYIPDATSPVAKKTIKVDAFIDAESIAFRYAVQIGTSGIVMENASQVTGTVWSSKTGAGSISGTGTAKIIGEAYAKGTIGSPPDFLPDSPPCTAPDCQAYQNQPSSPPMPTVDYNYWKDQACGGDRTDCTSNTTTCSPTCTISGTTTIGPQKYVGDLTISGAGANVTIAGPIWVAKTIPTSADGKLEIKDNSTVVKLSDAFGNNGTTIVVEDTITVRDGATILPTDPLYPPKGYLLFASQSTSTADLAPAIAIQSNTFSQGTKAIFYALYGPGGGGGIKLQDNTNLTALAAKKLTMKDTASLTYEIGLASASFSSGPGASWQIKKGAYRFTNSP